MRYIFTVDFKAILDFLSVLVHCTCIIYWVYFQSRSRQEDLQLNVQRMINERASEVERECEGRIRGLRDQLVQSQLALENKEKVIGWLVGMCSGTLLSTLLAL